VYARAKDRAARSITPALRRFLGPPRARRARVAEQQIQRWEANDYAGVNLERLQSIADALGIRIHETITYRPAA
jgi:Cro/C1-type HTH DNA-binding domain